MKITLCSEDIIRTAPRIKQIKCVNRLEFNDKTVSCWVTLNKKAIGISGIPENWLLILTFAHTAETVSATLDIKSDAGPAGGDSKLSRAINNLAQILLNGIIGLVGLEKRLLATIRLPDFASSNGQSITVDFNKLLKEKLKAKTNINSISCKEDSITFDFSIEFDKL
ncbi:MAG: hypothetical protein PHV82_06570 [Victivallaceae bacterium]|nr:hypothetical protein [Victivallaceae bacterium]